MLRRLALAVVATLLALTAVEVVLRGTDVARPRLVSPIRILGTQRGADITTPDDELIVRLRAQAEFLGYYVTNARGWRGPDVDDEPPPGTLRIVALGDSCTFGYGLTESQSWPAVLQRMLARAVGDVQPVEVVNAGVFGYSTWQNRRQLELDLAGLHPDVVVLVTSGHNDITGAKGRSDRETSAYLGSLAHTLAETRLGRLLTRAPAEQDPDVPEPGEPGVPWRVAPAETDENLTAIIDGAAGLGARCVFGVPVHAPRAHELTPAYAAFAEQVRAIARSRDVPLADPSPWSEGVPGKELFLDPVHPDAEGAAWIAASVLEALVALDGVLPEPRRSALDAWCRARRRGPGVLDGVAPEAFPPPYRGWLDALTRVGPDLQPPGDAPAEVRAHDPLTGTALSVRREGAESLLARRAPDRPTAEAHASRARDGAAFLRPPDSFAVLLGGGDPPPPVVARARALSVLEAWLGLPRTPHDLRRAGARTLEAQGRGAEAAALLDAALDLAPDDVALLADRAHLARRLGRPDEMRALLDRLRAVDAGHPEALTLEARGALKQGRTDQALALLDRALAGKPSHAEARYLRGRVRLQTGDLDGAELDLAAVTTFAGPGQFPDLPELAAELLSRRGAGLTSGRDDR